VRTSRHEDLEPLGGSLLAQGAAAFRRLTLKPTYLDPTYPEFIRNPQLSAAADNHRCG